MAAKKQTKEIVKSETQLGEVDNEALDALQAMAGAGQEGAGIEDMLTPRLTILQDTSAQVKKSEDAYIQGAEPGMIIDSVDYHLFDGENGIRVIPIKFRKTYLEWRLRSKGGGLVADHGNRPELMATCKQNDLGAWVTNDGKGETSISATAEYYCLVEVDGIFRPFLISMSGSQLKHSRRWLAQMNTWRLQGTNGQSFNPPAFARVYKLTTQPERNEKGSWFGWKIEPAEMTLTLPFGKELFARCREEFDRADSIKGSAHIDEPAGQSAASEADDDPM